MKLTMETPALADYVSGQLAALQPDLDAPVGRTLDPFVVTALERLEHCFDHIYGKGFRGPDGEPVFRHLHTDQWAMFLYLCSNEAGRTGSDLAERLYALNKALHGLDVFHEIELPDIFFFSHPVGTVLGRAQYGDYLAVHQGCTIGGNWPGVYPRLGKGLTLFSGSSIIGDCTVGDWVTIANGARVTSEDVPDRSTVFGMSRSLTIKPSRFDGPSGVYSQPPES